MYWSATDIEDQQDPMRILRHYQETPDDLTAATVAIGNFDGVHRGHQAVIGHAADVARNGNTPLIAMTFEPHPRRFFQPEGKQFRLTPIRTKFTQIAALGVDAMLVVRFDRRFSQLTGEEFIDRVLIDGLKAQRRVSEEV